MLKNYTKLTCICGKSISRKVIDGQVYACSRECRRKLLEKVGYQCAICKDRFPGDKFRWFHDDRYASGKRRFPYCLNCEQDKIQVYRDSHAKDIKQQHSKWREKCLSAGGDSTVRWYLMRRLGSYRKKNKELGIECNIDADYLLELFKKQEGKCYYTQEIMEWNNYGVGCGNQSKSTLSTDRLTPSLGYVKGNVVLCTQSSNESKSSRTEEEFYSFCENVLATKTKKNMEKP